MLRNTCELLGHACSSDINSITWLMHWCLPVTSLYLLLFISAKLPNRCQVTDRKIDFGVWRGFNKFHPSSMQRFKKVVVVVGLRWRRVYLMGCGSFARSLWSENTTTASSTEVSFTPPGNVTLHMSSLAVRYSSAIALDRANAAALSHLGSEKAEQKTTSGETEIAVLAWLIWTCWPAGCCVSQTWLIWAWWRRGMFWIHRSDPSGPHAGPGRKHSWE